MKRRNFIQLSSITGVGLSLSARGLLIACGDVVNVEQSAAYKKLIFELLQDWCDGLIQTQIIKPSDRSVHGLFDCPACDTIHARVMDSVYPFFYMAKETGQKNI
ncbi:hypothetical protein [Maribacter sp. R86514]|uniref:hypothetical protein n=1 Tax=Maribacter sp. R86514 TaxID=3093854 RepID=UPI0037C7A13F